MKLIRTKLNMTNGSAKTIDSVTLYEGEQYSTKLIGIIEGGSIVPGDQFYIEVLPKSPTDSPVIYNAEYNRLKNQIEVVLPRVAMDRGNFKYTFVRYNDDYTELQKWYPKPLFISVAGDITLDTLERRPDIFAELNRRVIDLEDKITRNM